MHRYFELTGASGACAVGSGDGLDCPQLAKPDSALVPKLPPLAPDDQMPRVYFGSRGWDSCR